MITTTAGSVDRTGHDPAGRLDPVQLGHPDVEQAHVGAEPRAQPRPPPARSLPRPPPRCRAVRRGSSAGRCARSPGRPRPPPGSCSSGPPVAGDVRPRRSTRRPGGAPRRSEPPSKVGAFAHPDQAVARRAPARSSAHRHRGPSGERSRASPIDPRRPRGWRPRACCSALVSDSCAIRYSAAPTARAAGRPGRRSSVDVARAEGRRAASARDVGDASLRRELGLVAVAQHPHHRAHLLSVREASSLDDAERFERASGSVRRHVLGRPGPGRRLPRRGGPRCRAARGRAVHARWCLHLLHLARPGALACSAPWRPAPRGTAGRPSPPRRRRRLCQSTLRRRPRTRSQR